MKQWKNDQSKWLFKIYENTALIHSLNENDDYDGDSDYSKEKEPRTHNIQSKQKELNDHLFALLFYTSFFCACVCERGIECFDNSG